MGGTRNTGRRRVWPGALTLVAATMLATLIPFPALPAQAAVAFEAPDDLGITVQSPTAIDWGPDDRLYVMQMSGQIRVFDVTRSGSGNFSATEVTGRNTNQVRDIDNHNDDGSASTLNNRLSTGMIVVGTATTPVIYATSSDPRIAADKANVDTNSGVVSRLTWNGSGYNHVKLVQGLPRSKENHGPNGLHLDTASNTLYIAQGGNTNAGGPSPALFNVPEFAYSAAILSINLGAIGNGTCNLPTLQGGNANCLSNPEPWGGEDGANMAKILAGVPVQVHAPGFRNSYDAIRTQAGHMFTIDNGLNQFFGKLPVGVNTPNCNNTPVSNNTSPLDPPSRPDHLERITGAGYYGGHPNPTRGNPAGSGFSGAVPAANPIECNHEDPLSDPAVLATFDFSTNSIDEFTASSFGGEMQGDLLAVEFSYQDTATTRLLRIDLNAAGTGVGPGGVSVIGQPGGGPLGVVALDDDEKFPGAIFVANWIDNNVVVFAPDPDADLCTGANNPNLDEDGDGFDNADEIDNGTNPCSASDTPPDWDGDFISDLNDLDDDNDGILDVDDAFALDSKNGTTTTVPVIYQWDNNSPSAGGLLGLGFTGMMTNGSDDYLDQHDPSKMTVIGAGGIVVVDEVTNGDALGSRNDQDYGFQFGVKVPSSPFAAHTKLISPFSGINPQDHQSQGLFIGDGTQDGYLKVVAEPDGISVLREVNGSPTQVATANVNLPGPASVDLWLAVDPGAKKAQAFYSVNGGSRQKVGGEVSLPSGWLAKPLAVGIISTSRGAPSFGAAWDFFEVKSDSWNSTSPGGGGGGGGDGFTDIAGSTFINEINWLAEEGITKGCNPPANSLFCPEDFVTRGQMAAFLHRALDDVLTPGSPVEFNDDNGNTFEADIEWLGATGVTKGCNPPANDRFCPDDLVTRGQMAAFLHRALDDVLTPGSPVEFNDDNGNTFENDIEWLGATGVTKGCNPPANDRFCPNDNVTREQMAAFLYRALE